MYLTKSKTISKLSHHAAALAAYADTNEQFANLLYNHLKNFPQPEFEDTAVTPSTWLLPTDEQTAEVRLAWLMQEITTSKPEKAAEAHAILATWAKQYQAPKDLVIGIVGLAIIGPTLGLIKKKKKGKSQMKVLLNQSARTKGQKRVLALTLEASTGLLGNELASVGGQAYRLDPELADWLFAEHDTMTAWKSTKDLHKILTDLENESLPHFKVESNNELVAIAIAPCVSDKFGVGL